MNQTRQQQSIETLLSTIFDHVADGVTVLDRRGILQFVNAAGAELMGHDSPAEVIGRPSSDIIDRFELLDEAGEPFDLANLPTRVALAGEEEEPEAVVCFRLRESAQERWSLIRARVLRGETREDDLVVTAFQDITNLKLAARRLTFLADASVALAEADDYADGLRRVADLAVPTIADWCVVDVLEVGTEVRRLAVVLRDPTKAALVEEYHRRWPPTLEEPGPMATAREAGGRPQLYPELSDEQLATLVADPERLAFLRQLHLRTALVVPLAAHGQILGSLTLVMSESGRLFTDDDVTMAADLGRRAGTAIDTARLMWEREEAIRLRDDFIASASHDMRTPLAAVRGYAQLSLRHLTTHGDDPDLDGLKRWIGDIDLAAGRLTRLVSEFMDASLIRGGQDVPLQQERTDLVPLVAERVEEHRLATADRRFRLVAEADSLSGLLDATRVGRVLDNLLSNAAKFSSDGSEIVVTVSRNGREGRISVADSGMGIDPRDLEHIFAQAYRGLNARRLPGTGLGLYGSRRLVELMGGTISVESELGKGSTFTIRLPLAARPTSGTNRPG